jgi:beta-xylosidase
MEAQDEREKGICIVSFGTLLFMPSVAGAKSTDLKIWKMVVVLDRYLSSLS